MKLSDILSEKAGIAVVDVETTGLFPGGTDRIIEIAIINTDLDGNIVDKFETLINPLRDVGPSRIHHITAGMVKNAPTFSEIYGEISKRLTGKILIGHNINFDYRFLLNEYERIGYNISEPTCLCTLNLSKRAIPSLCSYKLSVVCERLDIIRKNQHSALGDCMMTTELFHKLMSENVQNQIYNELSKKLKIQQFPPNINSVETYTRKNFINSPDRNLEISKILQSLPEEGNNSIDDIEKYFLLLDEILADRYITNEELSLLNKIWAEHNYSKTSLNNTHKEYLKGIIKNANLDGVISKAEMSDIKNVASILDIKEKTIFELVEQVKNENNNEYDVRKINTFYGKTICFTGELCCLYNNIPITKEIAGNLATEKGIIVSKSVTKKLDYLIAADPETMSGKAKKAREYGIPIISEMAFWNILGIQVS